MKELTGRHFIFQYADHDIEAVKEIMDTAESMYEMYRILEGEHIILRKAKTEDHKSMLKNVWSDEAVFRWMLFQPTFTEEEAVNRCQRSIDFQKSHYAWFVARKDTDEAIGICAIKEPEVR